MPLTAPRPSSWEEGTAADGGWRAAPRLHPRVNEISLSGGDSLAWFFRKRGVGKLVGARTFGGMVGVWLIPFLIDGGELRVPHEGIYESSDAWAIEGHGVEPDIAVRETPTELAEGRDPQLEAAVAHLRKELEGRQRPPTPRPPGY